MFCSRQRLKKPSSQHALISGGNENRANDYGLGSLGLCFFNVPHCFVEVFSALHHSISSGSVRLEFPSSDANLSATRSWNINPPNTSTTRSTCEIDSIGIYTYIASLEKRVSASSGVDGSWVLLVVPQRIGVFPSVAQLDTFSIGEYRELSDSWRQLCYCWLFTGIFNLYLYCYTRSTRDGTRVTRTLHSRLLFISTQSLL